MHFVRVVLAIFVLSGLVPVLLFLFVPIGEKGPSLDIFRGTRISTHILPTTKSCEKKRYQQINSLNLTENDFIPYTCHNYRNAFITVLGMALKPFNKTKLNFYVNGSPLKEYSLHYAQKTFAFNAPVTRADLAWSGVQTVTYVVNGCAFSMTCDNYHPIQKEELNICVYTKHSRKEMQPFLDHYNNFADRIFIYNSREANKGSFDVLKAKPHKYRVIPWYLEELRDLQVSSHVYDELVAHNWRNYPRDAQKVQTNDCMYRNRETDLVLMIDDDEYLNYQDRGFYRSLYQELKDRYDDILVFRNFCTKVVGIENRLSVVFNSTTVYCKQSERKRLEKALVLPTNCPLYEIHRCTRQNSFKMKHLNVYLTHRSYEE